MYETFKTLGIDYGQSYQGIEEIYVGEGQVLAKLSLVAASAIEESYVLHPGIMDAALQAVIGLLKGESNLKPYRPVALEELEVLGKCTTGMWALLRVNDSSKTGEKLPQLDIDLADETGTVRIRLKGTGNSRAGSGYGSGLLGNRIPEWADCQSERTARGTL